MNKALDMSLRVPQIVGKVSEIVVTFSVPSPSRCPLLTFTDFGDFDPCRGQTLSQVLGLVEGYDLPGGGF